MQFQAHAMKFIQCSLAEFHSPNRRELKIVKCFWKWSQRQTEDDHL